MTSTNRLVGTIAGVALSAVLIFAYATGPDPRHTGAPGDDPLACATSGCHTGTALNGGGGNVVVNFQNGQTYTPGAQQTFTIVVTDSRARVYGFQMTARLESNLSNGQAGDFTAGTQQIVLCDNGSQKVSRGCPSNAPVEFIEHNSPFHTNTISVQWTAPSTNVGNIHIYVAANAANGDGNNTGDHIYTANYTLTPPVIMSNPPTISAVVSASGFNSNAGLASGTWLEIYGTNLSTTSRGWATSDFNGSNAPTSLDGVSVTVDGIPAYVDYVSPGQINVQAPDDPNTGAGIQVVVTNSAGQSNGFSMQKNIIAPAVLAPSSFNTQGHQWIVALHSDQSYVGKTGLISGLTFRPAKVGETIVIYGIGFGPVTPNAPAGVIATQATSLQTQPHFRFGQTPATLVYSGLAPNFVGLYQFNVTVPNVGAGDMQLNIDVGGVTLNQNCYITVTQ
jgi:uncharacterized protein (TIGR03437 family)